MAIKIKEKTDDHTINAADLADIQAGDFVIFEMNKAASITLTVPQASDLALPAGAVFGARRTGAGALTIIGANSMSIASTSGGLTDPGANILMTFEIRGSNDVLLQNGAAPPGAWTEWIPDFTGVSSITGIHGRYQKIGKTVHVKGGVTASSDGTNSFTLTNLPAPAKEGINFVCRATSGTSNLFARGSLSIGSSVVSFFAGPLSETWATTNAKNVSFAFTYESE